MMDTTPVASGPQRLRALQQANNVRLARAALKQRIADGHVSAADVIRTCPQEAFSWPVSEVLMSQRRWGNQRCRRFLETVKIGELKPVGGLTDRQKNLIADELTSTVRVPATV